MALFLFRITLRDLLEDKAQSNPAIVYLRSHAFGTIARDFFFYRIGFTKPFTDGFYGHLTPGEIAKLNAFTKSVRANYYWFPNLFGTEQSKAK